MRRSTSMSRVRAMQALMLAISLSSALNAAAAQVTYALSIANGRVPDNMRLIRVKHNDMVTLEWSTDQPITVHLHGYDIEQELKPGTVTQMTFTARATGRFTIEPHIGKTPSGGHAHGDVLVTIEVYP